MVLNLVKIDVNNEKFRIIFKDQTTLEHFKSTLLYAFVLECEHGILVYDITQDVDYNFGYLKEIIDKINEKKKEEGEKKPTYFMLGTKSDREEGRLTKDEDAKKFCQDNECIFIGETSSKNMDKEVLINMIKQMVSKLGKKYIDMKKKEHLEHLEYLKRKAKEDEGVCNKCFKGLCNIY